MTHKIALLSCVLAGATVLAVRADPAGGPVVVTPIAQGQATPPQQTDIAVTMALHGGQIKLGLPDFTVEGGDAELRAAAKMMADVLWDDLDFEKEFYLVPRATTASIPIANTLESIPYDRWTQVGADAIVVGTVRRLAEGLEVDVMLVGVKGQLAKQTLNQGYKYQGGGCALATPRFCAHFISDDIHKRMRGVDGIARTKLTFISDRDYESAKARMPANAGRVSKEVYIADYDGAAQQRVTANHALNFAPVWSPDVQAIAYSSWASSFPDIYIASLFTGRAPVRPARGGTDQVKNWLAAWSPDGERLAYASTEGGSGRYDIWVMNRDGTGKFDLTPWPTSDEMAPTWSPTGKQIAFTSDRTGTNQIYVINIVGNDGVGLEKITSDVHCDHPTWSPAPFTDIAYTSGNGPDHNINLVDVATKKVTVLTTTNGDYGSPSFAPNGRHLAVAARNGGKVQIGLVSREGNVQRWVTDQGANSSPNWSRTPGK